MHNTVVPDTHSPTQARENRDNGDLDRCWDRIRLGESIIRQNEIDIAGYNERKDSLAKAKGELSNIIAFLITLEAENPTVFSRADPICQRVDMVKVLDNFIQAAETAAEEMGANVEIMEDLKEEALIESIHMSQVVERRRNQMAAVEERLKRESANTTQLLIKTEQSD